MIDLRDYPLPLFNEPGSLVSGLIQEVAQRWAASMWTKPPITKDLRRRICHRVTGLSPVMVSASVVKRL
jgi:hypothetical protein